MVAAAKADGHVTPEERARIADQLPVLGLGAEAQALIAAELDQPLDIGAIAALAANEAQATQIYTASLLVVDPEAAAEKRLPCPAGRTAETGPGPCRPPPRPRGRTGLRGGPTAPPACPSPCLPFRCLPLPGCRPGGGGGGGANTEG